MATDATITITLTPEEAVQLQRELQRLTAAASKAKAPARKPAAKVPAPQHGRPGLHATVPGHARATAKPTPPKGRPPARVRTILPPPTGPGNW